LLFSHINSAYMTQLMQVLVPHMPQKLFTMPVCNSVMDNTQAENKAIETRLHLGSDKDSASVLKRSVVLSGLYMKTLKEFVMVFFKNRYKKSHYALDPRSS